MIEDVLWRKMLVVWWWDRWKSVPVGSDIKPWFLFHGSWIGANHMDRSLTLEATWRNRGYLLILVLLDICVKPLNITCLTCFIYST
jgi:hypothetical protein